MAFGLGIHFDEITRKYNLFSLVFIASHWHLADTSWVCIDASKLSDNFPQKHEQLHSFVSVIFHARTSPSLYICQHFMLSIEMYTFVRFIASAVVLNWHAPTRSHYTWLMPNCELIRFYALVLSVALLLRLLLLLYGLIWMSSICHSAWLYIYSYIFLYRQIHEYLYPCVRMPAMIQFCGLNSTFYTYLSINRLGEYFIHAFKAATEITARNTLSLIYDMYFSFDFSRTRNGIHYIQTFATRLENGHNEISLNDIKKKKKEATTTKKMEKTKQRILGEKKQAIHLVELKWELFVRYFSYFILFFMFRVCRASNKNTRTHMERPNETENDLHTVTHIHSRGRRRMGSCTHLK